MLKLSVPMERSRKIMLIQKKQRWKRLPNEEVMAFWRKVVEDADELRKCWEVNDNVIFKKKWLWKRLPDEEVMTFWRKVVEGAHEVRECAKANDNVIFFKKIPPAPPPSKLNLINSLKKRYFMWPTFINKWVTFTMVLYELPTKL